VAVDVVVVVDVFVEKNELSPPLPAPPFDPNLQFTKHEHDCSFFKFKLFTLSILFVVVEK
jgi:hypothetical protein